MGDLSSLGITDTVLTTLRMWRTSKDVSKVAAKRGMKNSTIMTHLSAALEKGAVVPLEDVHITPAAIEALVKVIFDEPINSNVSRLGQVRDEYEILHGKDQFDWGVARLVVAHLKREHGCSDEGLLGWTIEDYESYKLPSNSKERVENQEYLSQRLAASSPGVEEEMQDIEEEIRSSPAADPPLQDPSNEIKPGRTRVFRKVVTKVGNGGDPKPQVALFYSEMERGNDNLNIFAQLVC